MPFRMIADPDHLRMLEALLKEVCMERGNVRDDPQREEIARDLMDWFRLGETDKDVLRAKMKLRQSP